MIENIIAVLVATTLSFWAGAALAMKLERGVRAKTVNRLGAELATMRLRLHKSAVEHAKLQNIVFSMRRDEAQKKEKKVKLEMEDYCPLKESVRKITKNINKG